MEIKFDPQGIAEQREKLNHVTPGPWEADSYGGMVWAKDPYGHDLMHVADVRGWGHLTGKGACAMTEDAAQVIQDANQEFIAYTRTAYPAALTEIERLLPFEAECAALRAQVDSLTRERDAAVSDCSGYCATCAFLEDCSINDHNDASPPTWYHGDCDEWQWRGPCTLQCDENGV